MQTSRVFKNQNGLFQYIIVLNLISKHLMELVELVEERVHLECNSVLQKRTESLKNNITLLFTYRFVPLPCLQTHNFWRIRFVTWIACEIRCRTKGWYGTIVQCVFSVFNRRQTATICNTCRILVAWISLFSFLKSR